MISQEKSLPDIPNTDPKLREVIVACINRTPELRPTTSQLLVMPFFKE